ncbi:MAG TPA: DnaJ domain-containing protein [Candidatus Nitrosocosmicus sp.]|nr:DnaJ domain-containing protein [Candidatus Nitrosocosmicus sp.]HET6588909.1 DnaJ domain-containing protein [Candidatus Nitrosocosmicus sp.]
MTSDDYYGILDIPISANQKEIKIAYRRLARKYHPDRNSTVSDDVMKNINIAFETLSDIQKRQEYDEKIKRSKSPTIGMSKEDTFSYQNQNQKMRNSDTEVIDYEYQDSKKDDYDSGTGNKPTINPSETVDLQNEFIPVIQSRYQIIVEPSLCLAFGSCEVLAPKVFLVEKDRQFNPKAVVISETAEDFETILDAAKTCPTKAIIIIDRYTGNHVFP